MNRQDGRVGAVGETAAAEGIPEPVAGDVGGGAGGVWVCGAAGGGGFGAQGFLEGEGEVLGAGGGDGEEEEEEALHGEDAEAHGEIVGPVGGADGGGVPAGGFAAAAPKADAEDEGKDGEAGAEERVHGLGPAAEEGVGGGEGGGEEDAAHLIWEVAGRKVESRRSAELGFCGLGSVELFVAVAELLDVDEDGGAFGEEGGPALGGHVGEEEEGVLGGDFVEGVEEVVGFGAFGALGAGELDPHFVVCDDNAAALAYLDQFYTQGGV